MSGSFDSHSTDPSPQSSENQNPEPQAGGADWDDALAAMELNPTGEPTGEPADRSPSSASIAAHPAHALEPLHIAPTQPPVALVETAFLASTTVLLWMVGYYFNLSPWLRILYPIPIALIYLRWQARAAGMTALVATLLLAVLMGPVLSLLFLFPTGLIGIHLGFMWQRRSPWFPSIVTAAMMSTLGTFFRLALLSIYLGEDLWVYTNNRITDIFQWMLDRLVDWGILGIDALGQTNPIAVQIIMVLVLFTADLVYLFTVHLAAWLLLDRLGNPIPEPPRWVQVLLEEEV